MKKKKQNNKKLEDYIKANRRGSREAELENSTGFKAVTKIHKSEKTYNRKNNKNINLEDE
jgi:hypothetical protein